MAGIEPKKATKKAHILVGFNYVCRDSTGLSVLTEYASVLRPHDDLV